VRVTARTAELASATLELAIRDAISTEPDVEVAVPVRFWHRGGHGRATSRVRDIEITQWCEIRGNDGQDVAVAFDRLVAIEPDNARGRVVHLHGPPGTGKTTALRALAHAWREWCRFEVVLDPERLFDQPSYLMSAVLDDDDGDDDKRWRLLVLEDCDELLRAEAKAASGQGLARLLNLADGVLGQGLRVLFALTTNERIGRLHPAITRPGRCLAQIEVRPLNAAEARAWAGTRANGDTNGTTLAELFATRDDMQPVTTPETGPGGMYL
jgi:hypothetical protein